MNLPEYNFFPPKLDLNLNVPNAEDEDNEMTALTLASPTSKQSSAPPQFLPLPPPHFSIPLTLESAQPFGAVDFRQILSPALPSQPRHHSKKPRLERSSKKAGSEDGRNELIVAPFPWATTKPAKIQCMKYLLQNNILMIGGEVECKKCGRFPKELSLVTEYKKLEHFIAEQKSLMNDRAPPCWVNPTLPICVNCNEAAKPVIASKNEEINWLFLLLGQWLGCCTLTQLKYFCMQSENHRTGAKDRVLYLTYLGLCNQLIPNSLYHPLLRY